MGRVSENKLLCETMKSTLISTLILCLSGCVFPYPHYNWKTPIYTGVVNDSEGKPVEGVEVFLEQYPAHRTETDSDGKFTLQPIKDFEMTALICPGPCDTIPKRMSLVAHSSDGQRKTVEVYTCLGHPSSQCNGRSENVHITIE